MSLNFPNIDPFIIRFGEIGISWYSLSYITGILAGYKISQLLAKKK